MNKVLRSYFINFLTIGLFGWAIISFFQTCSQFKTMMELGPSRTVTMDLTPWLLLIVLASILLYVYYKQRRTKKVSFWLFPLLFPEADEREKMITAQACRNSFISLWIMIPISTAVLAVYPMFFDSFSEFPIYLLLSVYFILITVFHITLYKRILE